MISQFYENIMESNKQILGTVLFCNGILTLTDSFEKQLGALSKSMNNSTTILKKKLGSSCGSYCLCCFFILFPEWVLNSYLWQNCNGRNKPPHSFILLSTVFDAQRIWKFKNKVTQTFLTTWQKFRFER